MTLKLEFLAYVQLLSQVMRSVKALHGAGYAHCNIKPSNTLRIRQHHDWALADFPSCCPAGAEQGRKATALETSQLGRSLRNAKPKPPTDEYLANSNV